MTSKESNDGIPDLTLERYHLGELPESAMADIRRQLNHDAALRERLERLETADGSLRERYARENIGRMIRARVDASRTPSVSGRLWAIPAAVGATALLVMAIVPQVMGPSGPLPVTVDSGIRLKGLEPQLSLYRKTDAGSEALTDGDLASEGDLIRLGYTAAGRSHGVIVSIDGGGTVTLHLPERGAMAAQLESDGTVLLSHAYELDAAPGFERFYLVASHAPFPVDTVLRAAARLIEEESGSQPRQLVLGDGGDFHQSAVSLLKEQ